jgi:aspartokinase
LSNLLVMKFGGTSMGSAERIRTAASLCAEQYRVRPVAAVVSAMSKVTDLLLETLRHAEAGDADGVEQRLELLRQRHVTTAGELLSGESLTRILTRRLQRRHADGRPTTLGRGGSDFSASILAAALDAAELWIWTDVDGIMSADPRLVPDAQVLEEITYAEAAELAYNGAKVLHPRTLAPLVEKKHSGVEQEQLRAGEAGDAHRARNRGRPRGPLRGDVDEQRRAGFA